MYEILTYASMNYYKWILSFSLFIFKYKKAFFIYIILIIKLFNDAVPCRIVFFFFNSVRFLMIDRPPHSLLLLLHSYLLMSSYQK